MDSPRFIYISVLALHLLQEAIEVFVRVLVWRDLFNFPMASSSLLRSAAASAPRADFFSSPSSDHSKVRDDVFASFYLCLASILILAGVSARFRFSLA